MADEVTTAGEFESVVVDLSNNSTVVTTKRAILRGIYVNTTMSAHECAVKNGSTTITRIPASSLAGSWFPCSDAKYLGGITIDPDDSAAGEIRVDFKTIP